MKKWSYKFWVCLGIGIVSLGGYFYVSSNVDPVQLEQEVNLWLSNPLSSGKKTTTIVSLSKKLHRSHPLRLQVIQKLLLEGEDPSALCDRKDKNSFAGFSRISLKISKGDLEGALSDSLSLKDSLESSEHKSYLYAINLYRVGLLQKKLGRIQEAQATWHLLESARSDPAAPVSYKEAVRDLSRRLADESLSVLDFISED